MAYGKINKSTARRLYEKGEKVWLFPNKTTPGSIWFSGIYIQYHPDMPRDFDTVCNEFRYYNCTKETGLGIHFYRNIEHEKESK